MKKNSLARGESQCPLPRSSLWRQGSTSAGGYACASGSGNRLTLRAGNGGEIALLENAPVMQFVSGDNEGQRAHRHFVLVGDAAAEPGVSSEPAQQSDTSAAHVRELLRQIGERAF